MKEANNAPVYITYLYNRIKNIVNDHGYHLCVHGSVGSDFDLVCIPKDSKLSSFDTIINEILQKLPIKEIVERDVTHHGRQRSTLVVGFGTTYIDFSLMPGKS